MAEPVCAPHDAMVSALVGTHGETRMSMALSEAVLIETFANAATGTWTMIGTTLDMVSCVIVHGTDYAATPQGKPA